MHTPKPLRSFGRARLQRFSKCSSEQKEINHLECDSSFENFKEELEELQRQTEIQEELLCILYSWSGNNTKQPNCPPRVSNTPQNRN
jgi:hypothetical protein